jgi:Zn-dependent protease
MLSLVWLLFVIAASVVLHELGHAFAAHLCGFDVFAIRFGLGKPIWTWRWNRIDISIGFPASLASGIVEYSDHNRGTIPQRMFVAVAGLLANGLLVYVGGYGDSHWHKLSDYWATLGITNMVLIAFNLVPMPVGRSGSYVKLWSDGGRILGLIQERFTGKNFSERY